jgi:alkanesulfonate monooxygenase SsuD/methylene tetrahydromethanopterin reductase-like flavin-dependent oxidoreductase (luciferase family)
MALRFGTYTEFQCPPGRDHAELIWDVIEVGVQADQLGYSVFTCLEHPWFEQFAINPSPIGVFCTLAQRTRNIRFRCLCHTLPLHNPFVLAGELAQADILLNGRLDVGIGRGHAWLQEPANIVLEENVARFPECVDILIKAWTEERFSFDGQYYQAKDLSVVPRPLQQPHPPIWQVGTSAKWVPRAVENGWGIALGGPAPNIAFEDAIAKYHEACRDAGRASKFAYIKAVYLDEDREKAIEEGRRPLKNFIDFNVSPMDSLARGTDAEKQRLIDAGYGFYAADDFIGTRDLTYEQLLEHEIVYAGDPKSVGAQLVDLWDRFRFDEFLLICHNGGTSRWQSMKTQELFARKVRPLLESAAEKATHKSAVSPQR